MYYESYFELTEAPFSISPDPRYLYLTQNHREALAHLLYGVSSNGGFVLLTGEIGAGKTTLCQCLLEQLPDNTDVAYILNPKLETWEFLAAVCDELDIAYPATHSTSLKLYIDLIHQQLLNTHARGRNTVLMVDEAQNLSLELIEHLRLLTNLETREKKLLQIMLVGQPELRDKIALPEMQQMAQRITARYHLDPLVQKEVAFYVRHRLEVAGSKRELFTADALQELWRFTRGVPRLINIICDRALLGACVLKRDKVDATIISQAAEEVLGRGISGEKLFHRKWVWASLALALMLVAFGSGYIFRQGMAPQTEILQNAAEAENLLPTTATSLDGVTEPVQEIVPRDNLTGGKPASTTNPGSVIPLQKHSTPQSVTSVGSSPWLSELVSAVRFPETLSPAVVELSAFNALFHQWGVNYVPQADLEPCQFAPTVNLGCLRQQGNLAALRQLDRPAILSLYDGQGRSYAATLLSLGDTTAVLALAGQLQKVLTSELDSWWYGEYLVLWKMPRGYQFPFAVGSDGEKVRWLLQKINGTAPNTGEHVYNSALENKVKSFQRNNGLVPDGVVGRLTIIALNKQFGSGVPKLSTLAKE